jgi:hypothetical protein
MSVRQSAAYQELALHEIILVDTLNNGRHNYVVHPKWRFILFRYIILKDIPGTQDL